MSWESVVDELLCQWILTGGDFDQMVENALKTLGPGAHSLQRLRDGARVAYARIQAADLTGLRQLADRPTELRAEIAAILRW